MAANEYPHDSADKTTGFIGLLILILVVVLVGIVLIGTPLFAIANRFGPGPTILIFIGICVLALPVIWPSLGKGVVGTVKGVGCAGSVLNGIFWIGAVGALFLVGTSAILTLGENGGIPWPAEEDIAPLVLGGCLIVLLCLSLMAKLGPHD